MIEFFTFSSSQLLTSLRFLFVMVWASAFLLITVAFFDKTVRAFSYGRVLLGMAGRIAPVDYLPFIKHCYRRTSRNISVKWQDGSYWNGVGDWAYFDKKSGKWTESKNEQN